MPITDGLRWVWRIASGAVVCALVLTGLPAIAAGSAPGPVVAYPRCTIDEDVNGWAWFAGSVPLGVTREPSFEYGGATHLTDNTDCFGAGVCLGAFPELSGRLATIVGTVGDDHLVGTSRRDLLVGRSGDDELRGGGGGDVLCGGTGDDVLRGARGDDRVIGDAGDDLLFGGPGEDQLVGGPGRDALYGHAGRDRLAGGTGDDSCVGGGGLDAIVECRVAVESTARYGGEDMRDFTVEVEAGLDVSRAGVIAEIDRILADDRSWIADGDTGFRRTKDGGDFTIIVASPDTVDRLCAPLGTGGYLSCRNGSNVILNVDRWMTATDWWPAGLETYREYLVNHEVGHLLGRGHVGCPGEGEPAPVMMQQTKGLGVCVANGWPYAEVAAG